MNDRIKFSVVIPVYNAEKYLKKCLDSVLKQTYQNIEVIAVDDGSTDKSGKILDKYAQDYTNLIVIHQENKGVSEARKAAVSIAVGDYISFLDADDWYEPNFFETVYKVLTDKPYPIIQVGYNKIRFGMSKKISSDPEIIVNNTDNLRDFINGYGKITYTLWNKVYKSRIIKDIICNLDINLKIGEDAYLNSLVLSAITDEKISLIPDCLYNYRQGSGISSSNDKIMIYEESMKFKKALIDFTSDVIKDEALLKSIYVDICSITKYYTYIITESYTHTERKELIENTVFHNPSVIEAQKFFSANKTNIEFCNALLTFDAEQYCVYIENYSEEYKKNLTTFQRIQRILHI